MSKKLTTVEFIAKAQTVHGTKYNYATTCYATAKQKVAISCPAHGSFEQTPNSHLNGSGCPLCGQECGHAAQKKGIEEFIKQARVIHGQRYDYSLSIYVHSQARLVIVCPSHGPFQQKPNNHLLGNGCMVCSRTTQRRKKKLTTAQFLAKARKVFGDKYDYSNTVYTRSAGKVEICCPTHGVFSQTANSHLAGVGCRRCANEARPGPDWVTRSSGKPATLYLLKLSDESEVFYKIGVTSQTVPQRYKSRVADLSGYQYEVLAVHVSGNTKAVFEWEQSILDTFAHLHYRPRRWFGGATECFSSADEILAIFPL